MRSHPAQRPWPHHSLKQAQQNMCTLSTAWHCVSLSDWGDTSVSLAAAIVSGSPPIGDPRRPESRAGQDQIRRVRVLRAQVGAAGGMAYLGGRRRADALQVRRSLSAGTPDLVRSTFSRLHVRLRLLSRMLRMLEDFGVHSGAEGTWRGVSPRPLIAQAFSRSTACKVAVLNVC